MTEWPPPLLVPLHARLWTVRSRAIVAMILCTPAIVWSLLPASVLSSPAQSGIRIVLGWGVAIGLIFYLRAVILAAGIFDLATRARAAGHPASLIFEVALDRARDTAALVHGAGMYDIVHDRTRARVRYLRTLAGVLELLAGVSMLPLFCVALVLALRGAADILAFVLIPVLPFVFLHATSAIVRSYASILIHWDRGSEAWDPRPESDTERDARQSSARFPLRAFAASAVAGVAAVALFVCVASVIAAVLGTSAVMRYRRGLFISQPVPERMVAVEYMRSMRLPADSKITAVQAGAAYHNLMYPMGNVARGMREPRVRYDRFLWPHDVPPFPAEVLFDPARKMGLLPPARASLDSLMQRSSHPALALISTLARARDIDVTGTRYQDGIDAALIDDAGLFVGSDIWLGASIDAGRLLQHGDAVAAEMRVQEMISAGFLLIDHSPYQSDFETGVQLVGAGTEGLRIVFERTGRIAEARALIGVTRAATRAGRGQVSNGTRPHPSEGDLWQIATNATAYPSVRWTAFQRAVPTMRCGGLGTLMFGVSPLQQTRLDEATGGMVRIPSDSVLLNAVLHPSPFDPGSVSRRPGIRRLLRIASLIVGERQLNSPCLGAFTTRF